MIRTHPALVTGLICTTLAAFPAKADVIEIDDDGARWKAGGGTAIAAVQPPASTFSAPIEEVPAEIYVPDTIASDPAHHARGVPAAYQAKVAELSAKYDLSASLIEAMVWQESRWRHDAVSPVGAQGLAQLMPGTARDLGVDPRDPFANLEGGARYLREQLDRFDGDLEKALAAYNAGPGRVERAGGIPRIRETQNYVASIMGRLADHSRE
ncbi:lytic transglycosylase domain-containing protein [Qipengyuania aquimaris]|uniref:lytic transglycosylase domain-containing protein n=1 Tax=Qipengyuania aquimaris TaxID=255984 RepID=UPI001FD4F125|nr:lytic transglycosylase domain-containing protein [Qipengyuania aquimaris]UOR15591.1 lytic transglycosylase domain-containing protein [Qipengyuania aquimaris]